MSCSTRLAAALPVVAGVALAVGTGATASGSGQAAKTAASSRTPEPAPLTWTLDNVASVGGHPVAVVGTPRVVATDAGPAVEFDGATDGLFLDVNPLAGLAQFTVEVLFEPAADGPAEQRFLHFEESGGDGNRALLETRMLPGSTWCLDTFLRDGQHALTLIDRNAAHPAGRWHAVALTYDGRTMAHFVDGVRELEGPVQFRPLGAGRTSIGVRQNKVHWFKGRIGAIRITPAALPADRLLRARR